MVGSSQRWKASSIARASINIIVQRLYYESIEQKGLLTGSLAAELRGLVIGTMVFPGGLRSLLARLDRHQSSGTGASSKLHGTACCMQAVQGRFSSHCALEGWLPLPRLLHYYIITIISLCEHVCVAIRERKTHSIRSTGKTGKSKFRPAQVG